MDAIVRATIKVTADCGHEFPVSVIGLDTETDLIFPTCGAVDHFNADQIAAIEAKLDRGIADAATKEVAKLVNQGLADAVRGKKGIRYRPG